MPREKKPHLKRRKDGRFCCKYHGIAFYSNTSAEEAFALREEYKKSLTKGFRRQTVEDYALPWLKRSFPNVSDSTYTGLAIHLQHLVDEIGKRQIADIVASDLKAIYSNQYNGLSNSYIRAAKQLFAHLFDSAMADGLITHNPAREKASAPHRGKRQKERILTKKQREYIETLCTDHRFHPAAMAMLYAGLRPQECKALIIERDVDFVNNVITVQATAHVNGQRYEFTDEMKTEWSNRKVPLFPPLREALKDKHGYLITSADGKPVTIQAWKSAWESYIFSMETAINGIEKRWYGKTKEQRRLLEEGKLPPWIEFDIVPYTLRHAFCAMICRDNGVELNVCRRWMGHADAKMVLRVYDSVSDDREETERKKVENLLIGVQNEVQLQNGQPGAIDE